MGQFRMPPPDVVIVDPKTGRLTPDGYDLFKSIERIGLVDLADVSTAAAPTNGEVPIWNATNSDWEFGAN